MVLVAIPVHQRGDLVRHCLATVAELELPPGSEIAVFDDASPYVPALIAATKLSCRFERAPSRRGAGGMVVHIWRDFLAGPHEHLLFVDSDVIANRDAVMVGFELARRFDGLISLYNSSLHNGTAIDGELLAKPFVGNAGTFWSRRLAQLALEKVGPADDVDFAYCRLFARLGIPIAATARSRVQHIGLVGVNNRYYGNLDHGLGFVPDAPAQWHAIGFVYDELMRRQSHYLRPVERAPGPFDWLLGGRKG
jgi:hypothetical protein